MRRLSFYYYVYSNETLKEHNDNDKQLMIKKKQVCLTLGWSSVVFALGLLIEKKVMTYSDPMLWWPLVTLRWPNMKYSGLIVTYS